MGVQGLTSFIDANSQIFTDFKLRDTKIIIDGNNLYHFLYYNSNVPHQYAGDYDIFAKATKHFFHVLKACNVQPYVIFDGGYETDDRKLRTVLKRCKDRICLAGFLSHGRHAKVLPILVEEVFLQVLVELGVSYATCDFEADDQIASLANLWNCPVLSSDSDFFIFDLSGGYLPLGYFDQHVRQDSNAADGESKSYLSVQIYFCENLVKPFSLKKHHLPLLATLIGNDIVDKNLFEEFYAKVCWSTKSKKKTKKAKLFSNQRFQKISGVLSWLGEHSTLSDAIEEVVSFSKSDHSQHVKESIEKSLTCYKNVTTNLASYFEAGCDGIEMSVIKSYNWDELPCWFVKAVRQSSLPVFFLNAVCLHRIILLCQIENMQRPSAYLTCVKLRQVLYGILLKGDVSQNTEEATDKLASDKACFIEEYDRLEKKQQRNVVRPEYNLSMYGDLPSLADIPKMSTEERCNLILSVLDINQETRTSLGGFTQSVKFLLAVIMFVVRNATTKLTLNQLRTVLVCIVKVSRNTSLLQTKTDAMDCDLKDGEIDSAQENLRKFNGSTMQQDLDIATLHAYSQIQACFHASIHLNRLLICPFPTLNPAFMFNGTFIYNFCQELKSRANPDLYIAEMLGRTSALTQTYNSWLNIICDQIDKNAFAEEEERLAIKRSKKRASKGNAVQNGESAVDKTSEQHALDQSCSETETRNKVEAACEISNRFGNLMISSGSDNES